MINKRTISRLIWLPILLLSLSAFAFADTIRLKDGSIIKGKIVNFSNGQFVIMVGSGERIRRLTFFSDEIDSINFDSAETNPSTVAATNTTTPIYPKTSSNENSAITVGSTQARVTTNNPAVSQPTRTITNNSSSTPAASNGGGKQPITIRSRVLADNTANGWSNTGWVVRKGQKISISATGKISLGGGRYSSPAGISSLPDSNKLVKDKPTGGLIAVIGDDNNDFIFLGESASFIARRDGALFLGVNEGNLKDNSGAFDATIEVDLDITN